MDDRDMPPAGVHVRPNKRDRTWEASRVEWCLPEIVGAAYFCIRKHRPQTLRKLKQLLRIRVCYNHKAYFADTFRPPRLLYDLGVFSGELLGPTSMCLMCAVEITNYNFMATRALVA